VSKGSKQASKTLTANAFVNILKQINMNNIYTSVEQSSRERQELEARESEANLETDSYSAGFFDGLIGLEPSNPERHSYWSGYEIGYREYWAKKLGVEIPTEF
jgi:hypothetical protein